MIEFSWKCPNCGIYNTGDAGKAQDYTLECSECKREFEVYCDVQVTVTEIKEVK